MSQDTDEQGVSRFNEDLVKKYPHSNRRLTLGVAKYGLASESSGDEGQSVHISPYGIQFRATQEFSEGDLIKIQINIPDYWERKQKFVEYRRIDTPGGFKILAKVVSSEEVGKRGKRRMILARTVNMDEVDEQLLKAFLMEG